MRKPLSTVTIVNGKRTVKTTVCIPASLRPFVLREAARPYPGSDRPRGVGAWIVSLIRAARSASVSSSQNDRTLS